MNRSLFLAALLLFGVFTVSNAAEDNEGLGFAVSAFLFEPVDPDGNTESVFSVTPFNLTYVSTLGRDTRVFSSLAYQQYKIDPSSSVISQEVTRIALSTVYQSRFRVSRSFKPWLGLGLTFANEKYDKRLSVDTDGFLIKSFEDRKESGVGLVVDFTTDVNLFDIDLMFRTAYTTPFYDGSKGIEANLIWTY